MDAVIETVREAARDALEAGSATVEVTTVKEHYGSDSAYDGTVVVLSPREPGAAAVVVEVQEGQLAWLTVADGPGYEFYEGDDAEPLDRLRQLVAAVVAGAYEDEWRDHRRRRLLRVWLWETTPEWRATFHTTDGPVSTAHIGLIPPEGAERKRRFEPY